MDSFPHDKFFGDRRPPPRPHHDTAHADRMIRFLRVLVLIGATFVGFFSYSLLSRKHQAVVEEVDETPVILVVMSAVRPDYLSTFGARKTLAPRLDDFLSDAVSFKEASTVSTDTSAAVGAVMTGFYPIRSGLDPRLGAQRRLKKDVPTLAEILDREGYHTGAFMNAEALGKSWGFDRGFDRFDFSSETGLSPLGSDCRGRLAEQTTDQALEWIDRREGDVDPFFLMLHYQDPDADPWSDRGIHARDEWLKKIERGKQIDLGEDDFTGLEYVSAHSEAGQALIRPEHASLRAGYAASLAYADREFGRFLDGLHERDLYDDALIVFVADRGMAFFEHDVYLHHGLYKECVHIPLAIKFPKRRYQTSPRVLVQSVDILPTVADYLGLQIPETQGYSLMPGIKGEKGPTRNWCYAVGPRGLMAYRDLKSKLITRKVGLPSLFDMFADPEEKRDLASAEPERAEALSQRLKTLDRELALFDPAKKAAVAKD